MTGGRKQDKRNSIDLLPDIATPHVQAAILALKERRRTEADIREELNTNLLAIGCEPVSRSAFNRHKLHLMLMGDRVLRAREVASIFAEKLKDEPGADIGLLVGEYMKSIIYEAIADIAVDEERPTAKELSAYALTLMRLEASRKMTTQQAVIRKKELVETVDTAITEATKDRGLSADVISQLRFDLLGVIQKAPIGKVEGEAA
jgi:hypothetical protein